MDYNQKNFFSPQHVTQKTIEIFSNEQLLNFVQI